MRETDTTTTVRAGHVQLRRRKLSAEQMLDDCPSGAMTCAIASYP
jgi:hypothetical protein